MPPYSRSPTAQVDSKVITYFQAATEKLILICTSKILDEEAFVRFPFLVSLTTVHRGKFVDGLVKTHVTNKRKQYFKKLPVRSSYSKSKMSYFGNIIFIKIKKK